MSLKWLGLIPFIALLVGMPLLNHPEPFVLGLPLPLAWATFCSLLTTATLALVFALDPKNSAPKNSAPKIRASKNHAP